jgi:hypothetical protein
VRNAVAGVLAAAGLSACAIGGGSQGPSPSIRTVCDVPVQAPASFEPLDTFREEYADHVGVRVGFIDAHEREIHAFAGIPGEFGEGLPAAGEVELAPGRVGLVSGSGRVWVVEWTEGGPCDPRAALGNGFSKERFLSLLREALVVADTS